MSTNSKNNSEKLVGLARQFDDQLQHGSEVLSPLANANGNGSKPDTGKELSPEERGELKEAKAALYFLNRVRTDFENAGLHSSVILPNELQSTVRGLETVGSQTSVDLEIDSLGRFEIIETIGQGGFAKVFRAMDPVLGREVALKVPKPHMLASEEARLRFQRESRAVAMLSHPGIVPLFEAGSVGPITYIASEYCPGTDLANWLKNEDGLVDSKTAAAIVAKLADAVEHAHQRGIIHRDLKPANVLVLESDEPVFERLRVTDFGMARQINSNEMTVTVDGAVVGTPAYMSPEQARGSQNLEAAADIFSLGVMLYELLTGKLPFKKSNHVATLISIEQDTPVSPRSVNPAIPKDLEAICLKCLEKSVSHRYSTAFSLGEDLRLWLDGRKTSVRPITSVEKLTRWIRREPALAAALTFAFVSLASGLALTGWQWNVATTNLEQSNMQRNRALHNVQLLGSTVEEVLGQYGELISENDVLDEFQRGILEQMISVHMTIIDEEAREVEITPRTIDAYTEISRIYRNLAEYEKAQEVSEQGKELYERLQVNAPEKACELIPSYAMLLGHESNIWLDIGERQPAEDLCNLCLELTKEKHPEQSIEDYLMSQFYFYRHRGLAQHGLKKLDEAFESANKGFEYSEKLIQLMPNEERHIEAFARSHQDVASIASRLGKHELSTKLLNNALKLINELENGEQFEGDYRYRIAFLNGELSFESRLAKDFEKAETLSLASIDSLAELVVERPNVAYLHDRMGHMSFRHFGLLKVFERYEELDEYFPHALHAVESVKKPKSHYVWMMNLRRDYANALIDQNKNHDMVARLADEALEICEEALLKYPKSAHHLKIKPDLYRIRAIADARITGKNINALDNCRLSAQAAIEAYKLLPDDSRARSTVRSRVGYLAERTARYEKYTESENSILEMTASFPNDGYLQFHAALLTAKLMVCLNKEDASTDLVDSLEQSAAKNLQRATELGYDVGRDLSKLKKKGITPELHRIVKRAGI